LNSQIKNFLLKNLLQNCYKNNHQEELKVDSMTMLICYLYARQNFMRFAKSAKEAIVGLYLFGHINMHHTMEKGRVEGKCLPALPLPVLPADVLLHCTLCLL